MSNSLAIQVDHAFKRYSDSWVLKGLSMAVPKASIYALLGPSGCGKSTLFSCIVGQMNLDSGAIAINCERRSEIGYMPQSVALYLTMTIGETFSYYGKMGNMTKQEIAERTRQLANLLELPPLNRVVETLSGGQQRRISLSVALISNPTLLLLDEPTVGLDPVLSHSIWNHLVKLARDENKTIVITTHYIEEAKQANTVGLMRGGVLLCEETPEDLMKNNNCDSMEQVFLKLSAKQEMTISTNNNNNDDLMKKREKLLIQDTRDKLKRSTLFSLAYVHAEVTKNAIFIWRNKPMLSLLVLLPLTVSYLFSFALGADPKGIQLAVINHELKESIEVCFNQRYYGCNFSQPLSCRVLNELRNQKIELIEYWDFSKAMEAAKFNPTLWGVLEIPKNYTESLVERFTMNLNTPDEVIEQGEMSIWIDNSNYFIGKYIEIYVHHGFLAGVASLFSDCGWPVETFKVPIKFQTPVFGALRPNMTHYVGPPILILIIFYLPMAYTMSVILQEKLNGVLERSMVAGLRLSEVLLGHSMVQLAVLVMQTMVLIIVVFWWHSHPMVGSIFWTTCLLLLQGFSGLAFGFLMAVSVDNIIAGSYLSIGTLLTYFFLSGSLWPQEGLNPILQMFKPIIPISYSVEALRGLTARGWPITHPIVGKGFLSVASWTLFFILLALFIEEIKRYFNKK